MRRNFYQNSAVNIAIRKVDKLEILAKLSPLSSTAPVSRKFVVLALLIGVVIWSFFLLLFWVLIRHEYNWSAIALYRDNMLRGWGMTIVISIVAGLIAVLLAVALTIAQIAPFRVTRWAARIYVEFIRGTPLITQVVIGYYFFANDLKIESRFWVGVFILAAFSAAYLSEIFRGGVESVGKSQWESGRAIGLTDAQIYRFVVIPQAIRRVLPGSAGLFADLVKNSSLLFMISVNEFFMFTREAVANSYASSEGYLPLALGYLAITLPISIYSRRMEARFSYEH